MHDSHPGGRRGRWTVEEARAWRARQGALVGVNYLPAHAANQLEHWQGATWSPAEIERELGWAAALGFDSLRVFLHDLVWAQGEEAYLERIDAFLGIASRHGLGVLFVFFDSCWHPRPRPGPQAAPRAGVHNGGWVQSPGVAVLRDPPRFAALEGYVRGVVRHFRNDARVQGWDLWNEPDNPNAALRSALDPGAGKAALVTPLLQRVAEWARAEGPRQPLTCGLWAGEWTEAALTPLQRVQLEASDVASFHHYGDAASTARRLDELEGLAPGRPVLCTEFMARPAGSTFEAVLPVLRQRGAGAYAWGLVTGRSQTRFGWESWQTRRPGAPRGEERGAEPPLWFHDVLRADGTPYCEAEAAFLRERLGRRDAASPSAASPARAANAAGSGTGAAEVSR
jgi:hypothetical protein